MSKGGEEVVARILFFFVGLCLLFISFFVLLFVTILHDARQNRRRAAFAATANRLGLDFDEGQNKTIATNYLFLDYLDDLRSGSDQYGLNVLSGDFQGHPVRLFDYHYLSANKVWWWSPSWKRHKYLSFIVLHLGKEFPELTMAREGFFAKIGQAIGFDDIDFESHAFSKRYVVRSKDKKFAYDFFNAKMIDYLLDQPVIPIEIEKHSLALGFDHQYSPKKIDPTLDHLLKIRSLMPNYLFAD